MKKLISVLLIFATLFAFLSFGTSAADEAFKYGDVDADGNIDSSDALLILENSIGEKEFTEFEAKVADVDGNGKVNSADALCILMFKTKLISSFDVLNKSKYIDPIIDGGKYTIGLTTMFNDAGEELLENKDVDMTITTDGTKKATSIKIKITTEDLEGMGFSDLSPFLLDSVLISIGGAIEMRYFTDSDGKQYVLMSAGALLNQYDDFEGEDMGEMLVAAMFADGFAYAETSTEKEGTTTYTCEKFADEKGSEIKYYFDGTTLKKIVIGDSNQSQTFKINSIKGSAEDSLLEISKKFTYNKDLA